MEHYCCSCAPVVPIVSIRQLAAVVYPVGGGLVGLLIYLGGYCQPGLGVAADQPLFPSLEVIVYDVLGDSANACQTGIPHFRSGFSFFRMRRARLFFMVVSVTYIDAWPGFCGSAVSIATKACFPFSRKFRTARAVNRATPSEERGFPFEVRATAASSSFSTSSWVTWRSRFTENPLDFRSEREIAVGWITPLTMWSGFQRDLISHSSR